MSSSARLSLLRTAFCTGLLGAVIAAGACGDAEKLSPSPADTGSGGQGGAGGATTSTSDGVGGCGIACAGEFQVGVGKALINPTLVETEWNDVNPDGYWEEGVEEFTDENGNGVFDATWMAGFGNGRPATGQNDDLEVRAIAFRHHNTTAVIAYLDAVGYFVDDMDLVRQDPAVAALDIDHIIIGATHTHEGVDTIGLWGKDLATSGVDAEYQALTRARAAEAIVQAVQSLRPARMRVAQTITADPGGTKGYVNDTRDPIIYDPTLTIARFTDFVTDEPIGNLVNWAAHPEYSGDDNTLLTADFVHWLREVTEQGLPAERLEGLGGTTVFVQGPIGGQVGPGGTHPMGPDGVPITQSGLPKAQAVGTNAARLALRALADDGEEVLDTAITLRSQPIEVQIDNLAYHLLGNLGVIARSFDLPDPSAPASEDNKPLARTQITYLQVGPLAMITAPGELHPELWVGGYDGSWSWGQSLLNEVVNAPDLSQAPPGPYLREIMLSNPGVRYPFVAGLAEDFLGYIVPGFDYVLHPTEPYFSEAEGDHYEETNSVGPLCEAQIQHPMLAVAQPR